MEDIDKFLSELTTDKEKKIALKAQLNFRKKVLKQTSPEKGIYLFSYVLDGKTKQCSAQQLASKLKTLVVASHTIPPPEHQDEDRRPLFVDRKNSHTFHNGVYVGRVISAVPGFPQWFNVIYEGDEAIYTFKLYDDYASGDLRIIVD